MLIALSFSFSYQKVTGFSISLSFKIKLKSAQNYMLVRVNEICMHTKFRGHGLPFQNWPKLVHGRQKINQLESAQKIHVSRD